MDEQERARLRAAIEAAEGGAPDPAAADALIRRMLTESRTIAVVGASPRPDRPSHGVLRTLAAAGWQILPINPMPEALRDGCLLYTSPSPRDVEESRMPSSA